VTVEEEPRTDELTIYQASRREIVFDVAHGAFSAAFEAWLGRTDVGAFADVAHAGRPKPALVHQSQPVGEQLFLVRRT
jgi:hypothetical protein